MALGGCAFNTDPGATRITDTRATLQASIECSAGETCDGYFRWRAASGSAWSNGPDSGPWVGPATLPAWQWTTPAGLLAPGTTYQYQWCGRASPAGAYTCVGPSAQPSASGSITAGSTGATSSFTTLPAPVTTVSAQQFDDSLGVNVKETYWNTIYGNWAQTLADAKAVGFTHLRVGIYDSSNAGWNARHWGDLRQAVADGFKLDVGINPDCSYRGTLANPYFSDCFDALRDQVGLSGVETIEWPNEYDTSGDPNWAANLASWGQQIYALAKSLGPIPVIGPSIVNPSSIPVLGNQSAALDFGNFHDYRGGTSATPQSVAAEATRMYPVTLGKPNVATEFGYWDAVGSTNGSQPPIDDTGAAVYTVRQYLEHLADGVSRSYVNQLYDIDSTSTNSNYRFGLIRSDGTWKPAAVALRNLVALIGTGGPSALSPLAWGVQSGDPTSDVRYLDVVDGDGTHALVLWRTAPVWNTTTQQDVSVAPVTVHVVGNFTAWGQADPMTGGTFAPGSGAITVQLGADPVVLHITP